MSEKLVSAEEAREMIEGPSPDYGAFGEVDKFSYDALATIIAQAEQIKRLQAALREAEVKRRQVWVEMGADIDPHGAVDWETQYDALTAEDMGGTQ